MAIGGHRCPTRRSREGVERRVRAFRQAGSRTEAATIVVGGGHRCPPRRNEETPDTRSPVFRRVAVAGERAPMPSFDEPLGCRAPRRTHPDHACGLAAVWGLPSQRASMPSAMQVAGTVCLRSTPSLMKPAFSSTRSDALWSTWQMAEILHICSSWKARSTMARAISVANPRPHASRAST